eukprot:COSAG01_NODE_1884_length_8988_cov_8.068624_4_plen_75_part_00
MQVLFLLEVDNVVYSVGLPENLKGQVETHWQIMLRETEQQGKTLSLPWKGAPLRLDYLLALASHISVCIVLFVL